MDNLIFYILSLGTYHIFVYFCGMVKQKDGFSKRQKAIDQYILIYCVDGNGWYELNGSE